MLAEGNKIPGFLKTASSFFDKKTETIIGQPKDLTKPGKVKKFIQQAASPPNYINSQLSVTHDHKQLPPLKNKPKKFLG